MSGRRCGSFGDESLHLSNRRLYTLYEDEVTPNDISPDDISVDVTTVYYESDTVSRSSDDLTCCKTTESSQASEIAEITDLDKHLNATKSSKIPLVHRASKIPKRIPQILKLPKPKVSASNTMMNVVPIISESQDPISYQQEHSVSEAGDQFPDTASVGSYLSTGFSTPKAPRLHSPDTENVQLSTSNGDMLKLLPRRLFGFILCVIVIVFLFYNIIQTCPSFETSLNLSGGGEV